MPPHRISFLPVCVLQLFLNQTNHSYAGHILLFSKAASVLSWKLDLGGLLWLWDWSCESIFFVLSFGAKLS